MQKKKQIILISFIFVLILLISTNVFAIDFMGIAKNEMNNQIRTLGVVRAGLLGGGTGETEPDPDEDITITVYDSVFYDKIKAKLNKAGIVFSEVEPTEDNTWQLTAKRGDIEGITTLDLSGGSIASDKISDLRGITNFKGLTVLNINSNLIKNGVDLNNNDIADGIEEITTLTNLKELYLSSNGLTDMPNLEDLTKLDKIDFSSNHLDLSFINANISLTEVYAANNSISTTGAAYGRNLRNLKVLDLKGNSIDGDLLNVHFPLSLTKLILSGNTNIKKIGALQDLRHLTELNLNDDYRIEDLYKLGESYVDALSGETYYYLENLEVLKLQNVNNNTSRIELSNLIGLKKLVELDLSSNNITSIYGVTDLDKLEKLYLNYNLITDITPFVIETTDQFGNPKLIISGVKHLEMKHNRDDNIEDYGLQNINTLYYMDQLEVLDLSENRIHDISSLEHLPNLEPRNLNLKNQRGNFNFAKKSNTNVEQKAIIESIFQNCKKETSIIYDSTSQGFTVTGNAVENEDTYVLPSGEIGKYNEHPGYYNIVFPENSKEGDSAAVTIVGGRAAGSCFTYTISNGGNYLYDSICFEDYILTEKVESELLKQERVAWSVPYILNMSYYDVGAVTDLELRGSTGYKVKNVKGLESFYSLQTLDLSNNEITSNIIESKIDKLKDLPQIRIIKLSENKLTNVDFIVNYTNLTEILLTNNQINNIDGFEGWYNNIESNYYTPVLTTLDLSGNKYITNIDVLAPITTLTTLKIANNDISSISALENMKELIVLDISSNKIKNIDVLEGLTKLNNLNIGDNLINDLSKISNLNLGTLDIRNNKIDTLDAINDMSIAELFAGGNKIGKWASGDEIETELSRKVQTLDLTGQKLTYALKEEDTGEIEIPLPSLFIEAKDNNNKLYTAEDYDYDPSKCTLTADGKAIIVNADELKNSADSIVTIKIDGGLANRSTFSVAAPIEATITYSTEEPTKEDVVATISFNRNGVSVLNNDGEIQYTFTENGEFTFEYEDEYGFTGTKTATVDWIDKEGPVAEVTKNIQTITKENVIVTITANEECKEVTGWELSEDHKTLTKTYTENETEEVTLEDKLGNTSTVNVKVNNIDKIVPVIQGVEEGNTYTEMVTISVTDDNLTQVTLNDGETTQTIPGSGKTRTCNIDTDGEYTITARDAAGNVTVINFTVELSGELQAIATKSTEETTKENVIVTIRANKECKELAGWELSEDHKTFTKTYTENSTEEVTIEDNDGNTKTLTVQVNNIDKVLPVIQGVEDGKTYGPGRQITITDDHLESVTVTLGGQESSISGTSSNTRNYTAEVEGEYTITARDTAGNESIVNFTIASTPVVIDLEIKNGIAYEKTVDGNKNYIENIKPVTKVGEFLGNVDSNGTIEIYKGNTKITDTTKNIITGMKVVVLNGSTPVKEYEIVVTGDIIGEDGVLDGKDLLKFARYKAGLDTNVTGAQLRATDIVRDQKYADGKDLLKMARIVAKIEHI